MSKSYKNAFTFAELMISLVVISILSAILYPTIAQFTPNSNKPLFKAAYRTLTTAMHEITNEMPNGIITDNNLCSLFCDKANVIHEQPEPNNTCNADCTDKILTTSNGMRWYFGDKGTYRDPSPQNGSKGAAAPQITAVFQVIVDVNASNNSLSQLAFDNTIPNSPSGRTIDQTFVAGCGPNEASNCGVFMFNNSNDANSIYAQGTDLPSYATTPPVLPTYNPDNVKTQDTFEIYINDRGKVISMSPAGWANLADDSNGNTNIPD